MLDSVAYQNEVVIAEHLHGIAYDTARVVAVGHEVQFIFLMLVNGICKAVFIPVYQIETVFFRQRSDLGDYFVHDVRFREVLSVFMSAFSLGGLRSPDD